MLSRRTLLTIATAGAATAWHRPAAARIEEALTGIKAVAFDGFAILDPRPALAVAKQLYPPEGEAFANAFQSRLFEYQWLRALGGRYADFLSIAAEAHEFSARQIGARTSTQTLTRLNQAFLNLEAWPDAAVALKQLKAEGIRLAFLSNMTSTMLEAGLKKSGLGGALDHVLSTDEIKTYKPDPRAYQLGVDAFKLPKEQIAFVASAGWDAVGSAWFGYPTLWINRIAATPEGLDRGTIPVGKTLNDLVLLLGSHD